MTWFVGRRLEFWGMNHFIIARLFAELKTVIGTDPAKRANLPKAESGSGAFHPTLCIQASVIEICCFRPQVFDSSAVLKFTLSLSCAVACVEFICWIH
jgi:hypothetical protein